MRSQPTFTVVLPVYHGGVLLRRCLEALGQLDYPPEAFEVLVVGARGDAGARRIVEEAAAKQPSCPRYVATDAATRAGAINDALTMASGRYLAFADDDVFVLPDWLRRLEEVFAARPDAGLVGGVDELTEDAGVFDLAFDAVLRSFVGSGHIRQARGPRAGEYYPRLWNMAMPREVALQAALSGGDGRPEVFKSSLPVHEDVELGRRIRRLGRTVLFLKDLKVRHRREISFGTMVRRDFLTARTCRREGIHRWPHRVLSAGLLGTGAMAVAAVFWPPARWALAAAAIAYGAALLAMGIMAAVRKRHVGVLLMAPVVAVGLHLARAAGYLVGGGRR